MEDWLKCQISPLVKYIVKTKHSRHDWDTLDDSNNNPTSKRYGVIS